MRYTAVERALIPPDLRALARVISDVDPAQFPELFTANNTNPSTQEVGKLLGEITGAPLAPKDLRLFQAVFMEMKHHLHGVDVATVADSEVSGVLTLTTHLDTACSEADIPLGVVFPHVKAVHNFFVDIKSVKFSVKQAPVFYLLTDAICKLLLRAQEELQRYTDTVKSCNPLDATSKFGSTSRSKDGFSGEDDVVPWIWEVVDLPVEFECAFADINGDLDIHLAHLRWYVEVCGDSIFFDSSTYIGDISVRKLWNAHVGSDVPACFSKVFLPALQLFPKWSHAPIMDVLDYGKCGVVSLYTLQRLLSVWGPFLLLDRNMKNDMRAGIYDLSHSLEYHEKAFAHRPDAAEGDFVVTLTNTPGEVIAFVLLPLTGDTIVVDSNNNNNNKNKNNNKNTNNEMEKSGINKNKLETRMIRFTQKTGAWVAEGLIAEEYETVHDACCALPEIFRRPCGTSYDLPDIPGTSASLSASPRVDVNTTAVAPTASSLHRACFRNNVRYVKTLLDRGSAVVVNTALLDLGISPRFSWTPLLCAVNNPNSDPAAVVQMLVEVDADVHICDDAACTALYYAIANGYVNATRILLTHCPTLRTSSSSEALLLALGAHHFHARESDIRRLSNVIPSVEMLEVLLPYQKDLRLVSLAVDIIAGKLSGEERVQQETDDPSIWHPDGEVELRTPEDVAYLSTIIAYHNKLCQQFRGDVMRAARLLYNHCYFLSCREHFKQDAESTEDNS
ncbi:uncharacterized protein TM35_000091610 [Trypanosoma theileri]|uniref:Uncharacterized protein n=1 Tax=Trypanosoma theileri TaxID=67003 RepID=A0A1X0NZT3_9TRYP|nr:uncharacterized protein TM35_000091610 [Trypanosoma theileri]ORC90111.1 hypothetical protein TM35_000091610 [Trypanosoma theileri]